MTRQIRFVLVTPTGERITQETAKAHGLEWYPYPHRRLLDGISAILRFTRAAPAGRYRIELTALKPGAPVTVIARFHSRVEDYLRMLRSIPNAQTPPAVPLRSSAVIGLDVPKIGEPCAFEVIVPDTSVEVSLALPGGRVLHPGDSDGTKMAWESVDRRGGKNAKDSGLLSVAFQTPIDGMHHVIAFLDSPPPGRYEVRATSRRASAGELRVALAPLGRLFPAEQAFEEDLEGFAAGPVRVAPRELSFTVQHYAGDKLDVVVDLTGEAVAEPPVFELLVEHRDKLRDIDIGTKYKDPEPIQVQPATFTRGSDGSYRTLMDLPRAGLDRIAVRAHGVTASGQAFQDEAFISNSLEVRPVVARLLSLSANGVASAGSQFDHLDVTANLDVIEPGEYWMVFQLRDGAGKALSGPGVSGKSTLQRGRQALTVPVPGGKVWSELGDGPIEVANVSISRINTFRSSFVRTDGASARTDIYKRGQWNPGGFYGEDTVMLHRLAPASSGRYRLAEVQWEVTTPGGKCYWNGWLGERISVVGGGLPRWLDFNGEGVLTPGRTVLSFIFDGTAVAAAPNRKPVFNAGMNCDSDPTKEGIRSHPQTLALNPSEFEPPTGTFFIESRNPVRIEAGALGSTTLLVRDKTAAQVRFTVKQAPPELETNLVLDTRPNASAFARLEIHPKPGTKPGRYYVEVEAASGKESAGAVVVVDVATGRPQVAALQELPPAPSRAALADAPSCDAIRARLRQGSGIVALDPLPDLMVDKRIVADPEALATRGRRVTGLTADGEVTIVLRIPANFEGERITVTVMNDLGRPSNSQNEDGSLASVQNADVRLSRLTTVAMKTSRGPMAFVLYRSPSDFNRDGRDDRAASRGITFQIESIDAPCFSFNWPR